MPLAQLNKLMEHHSYTPAFFNFETKTIETLKKSMKGQSVFH